MTKVTTPIMDDETFVKAWLSVMQSYSGPTVEMHCDDFVRLIDMCPGQPTPPYVAGLQRTGYIKTKASHVTSALKRADMHLKANKAVNYAPAGQTATVAEQPRQSPIGEMMKSFDEALADPRASQPAPEGQEVIFDVSIPVPLIRGLVDYIRELESYVDAEVAAQMKAKALPKDDPKP